MIKITNFKNKFTPLREVNTNIYVLSFAYQEISSELATWVEEYFHHLPSEEELRTLVNEYYNKITDEKILKGFSWNGHKVWLSIENQFNYKALYDLAIQTSGSSLPVTLKFGTDKQPSYVTFTTIDEFSTFYHATLKYIQLCYTDGWKQKDTFDYNYYQSIINSVQTTCK